MSKTHWNDRVQVDFKIRFENQDLFQECFLYNLYSITSYIGIILKDPFGVRIS